MELEERKLWELYKRTGRSELQEKLVMKYLNMVHYLANRMVSFTTASLERDDLYSAGCIGLLEAIERFDLDKNIEFKTFAMMRIKGAIIDEIRRFDWVPRQVRKKSKMIDAAVNSLFSKLSRLPTDNEVAEELDMTIQEYYHLTDSIGPLFLYSLDQPADDAGEQKYTDIIYEEYDEVAEKTKEQIKDDLRESIESLPERERQVIALYYYENLNLKEIGKVLGVTESRISQIHSSAMAKLRAMMGRKRV